jgi:hypothetical protein
VTQLPLRMTVAQGVGETPMSFCSRNAMLVGRTARDFCKDAGFEFQGVVDGDDIALQRLARRCRADEVTLKANATVNKGRLRYSVRGQALTREVLSRKKVRICPHCVSSDIEVGHGPLSCRPYGRLQWIVEPLRTCPLHGVGLVTVSDQRRPARFHDFSELVQPALNELARLSNQAPRRVPSQLEDYLSDRLSGKQHPTWGLLGALPFYAAATTCEQLGAVATHGINVQVDSFNDDDWYEAGAAGFEIAEAGEIGVRDLLIRIQANTIAKKGGDWGLSSMFGRLHKWLGEQLGDPAYLPVQEIFRQHVVETFPFGPGDMILGREVAARRLHSVRSASKEYGAHRKRLRKLLHAAGHISAEQLALTDDRILFEADVAHDLLCLISEEMPLKQAGQYLNIPRHTERALFEAGHLRPFIAGGLDRSLNHAFAKRDLDLFLQSLTKDAIKIEPNETGYEHITAAATRVGCTAVQIVELILSRKAKRVRFRPEVSGFSSIMVDPDEILSLLDKTIKGVLSLKQVERKLKTDFAVVQNLINLGVIPVSTVINPKTRWRQRVVSEEDMDRFANRFASLHMLATEHGIYFRKIGDKLREKGIRPAFDPAKVRASFYERITVENCIAELVK